MVRDRIQKALDNAIKSLLDKQPELLALDVTERALSHHLAIYIAEHFPDFDVDVEYNRDGIDPKRLDLPERGAAEDDIKARTVFPDIIVHKRNTDINFLVLEMKKSRDDDDISHDNLKLKAFKRELGYEHAAHVILGPNAQEIIWVD